MTDMTTVITCDKCGLSYRASLIPHECAEWTKGSNKHKGDVMERRDRTVINDYNRLLDKVMYADGTQARIDARLQAAREHATLVEQRDLLAAILQRVRAACNHRDHAEVGTALLILLKDIDKALTNDEQGEGRE